MRYWGAIATIAVALFFGGRLVRAHVVREGSAPSTETATPDPSAPAHAQGSSAARRAAIRDLLNHLAHMPASTPPVVAQTPWNIERSAVEPSEATQKRRARASAEIDEKAPGLSDAKRKILLDEADRLAWDKRKFRAAFLSGKMSEAEYVDALKGDIRAALSNFEEVLTDEEYTALFNRSRASGTDPFTLESLVGRPESKSNGPELGATAPNVPSKSDDPKAP